jgi:WD40 repeat protein
VKSGVTVVSVPDGAPLETLIGHQSQVHGVTFNATGSVVYTAGADGRLIAWDLRGSRSLATTTPIPEPGPQQFESLPVGRLLAVGAAGRLVAVANGDGTVEIFEGTAAAMPLRRSVAVATAGGGGQPLALAFDREGRRLAVGTDDGHVLVYDTTSWSRIERLTVHPLEGDQPAVAGVAFSPRDGTIAVGMADGRVLRFSRPGYRVMRPLDAARPAPGASPLATIAYSPDGSVLAAGLAGTTDDGVVVFDATTGSRRYTVPDASGVSAVTFTPDGKTLVVGDLTGLARFWGAGDGTRDGAPVQVVEGTVDSLAVDSTGRTLVAAGTDGATWLYDLATRTQIGTSLDPDPSTTTAALFVGRGDSVPITLAVSNTGSKSSTLTRWNLRASFLAARACAVARRNLTRLEWEQVLPNLPYAKVCPQFPPAAGTS